MLHRKPCWPKIQYMRWIVAARLLATSLFIVPSLHAQKAAASSPFQMEQSTSMASLRGIHAVGGGVAWASGTNGTVLRTEDSGFVWQSCAMPPGAEKLDFRGVWAWDAMTAIVMSSGPGDASRLYKTTDGCVSWKLLATNTDKNGFWDAIAFSDEKKGYLLGDPVAGHFLVRLLAADGVTHSSPAEKDPEALTGAGAFAASNTSIVIVPATAKQKSFLADPALTTLMFGTGGSHAQPSTARIYRLDWRPVRQSLDFREPYWTFSTVPLASSNEASGAFSLAFRNSRAGIAVGGDYQKPDVAAGTAAITTDSGRTWIVSTKPPRGYRSAVAWDEVHKAWVCAGPNGSDYSLDDGKTWQTLDVTDVKNGWNAISLPWFVGPNGRIGKLVSLPH